MTAGDNMTWVRPSQNQQASGQSSKCTFSALSFKQQTDKSEEKQSTKGTRIRPIIKECPRRLLSRQLQLQPLPLTCSEPRPGEQQSAAEAWGPHCRRTPRSHACADCTLPPVRADFKAPLRSRDIVRQEI